MRDIKELSQVVLILGIIIINLISVINLIKINKKGLDKMLKTIFKVGEDN